jgi:hypothetical protein
MKKVFAIILTMVMVLAISVSAFAEDMPLRYYQDPQYGWVTVSQLTVRNEASRDASAVARLSNATPMVVLGKVIVNGEEFYAISLRSVGVDSDGLGYVLCPGVSLGMREYIRVDTKIWARVQQSLQSIADAEISPGESRKIVGRSYVDGELWYSIQIEESHRGVGFVRACDVSEPFYLEEDKLFVQTYASSTNPNVYTQVAAAQTEVIPETVEEEEEEILDDEEEEKTEEVTTVQEVADFVSQPAPVNLKAGADATCIQTTQVRSAGADTAGVKGEITAGTTVYVYQVLGNYTQVVFNGQFGYVLSACLQQ